MTDTISIIGYESECHCDHCGRPLRHGVRVSGVGTIGADCLVAMIARDTKRFRRGKPDAAYVRTLAKLRERDNDASLSRMGYFPHHFVFPLPAAHV